MIDVRNVSTIEQVPPSGRGPASIVVTSVPPPSRHGVGVSVRQSQLPALQVHWRTSTPQRVEVVHISPLIAQRPPPEPINAITQGTVVAVESGTVVSACGTSVEAPSRAT